MWQAKWPNAEIQKNKSLSTFEFCFHTQRIFTYYRIHAFHEFVQSYEPAYRYFTRPRHPGFCSLYCCFEFLLSVDSFCSILLMYMHKNAIFEEKIKKNANKTSLTETRLQRRTKRVAAKQHAHSKWHVFHIKIN